MRFRVVALLFTLLLITKAFASSDADSRGRDLIAKAAEKTNIFALSSFRLNATVRIDNMGKPLDGTYSLLWNGPNLWREEIAFPGYSEIQVHSKGIAYLKRNVPYMPYRVSQLHATLGFSAGVGGGSFFNQAPHGQETIKKVHEQKIAGAKADCVEIVNELKHAREVCVDQTTGMYNRGQQRFVDSGFLPIGSKTFPRTMSLVDHEKPVVEVHITEFKAGEPLASALFEPPPGATSGQGCMNPVPGRLDNRIEPRYPEQDKTARNQGTVAIYAVIDKSGIPQNLQLVLRATEGLDKASLDAVRQWRYTPATCDDNPVETETIIEVHYTL